MMLLYKHSSQTWRNKILRFKLLRFILQKKIIKKNKLDTFQEKYSRNLRPQIFSNRIIIVNKFHLLEFPFIVLSNFNLL